MAVSAAKAQKDIPQTLIEQSLLETAIALQKQLPMQIDEVTTLNNAIANGLQFLYVFHVDIDNIRMEIVDIAKYQKNVTLGNVCSHSSMLIAMSHGVHYRYMFIDNC